MLRNFGEVIPGKLYRCGKCQAKELKEAILEYNIKRVVYLSETKPFLSQKTYFKLDVTFKHIKVFEYVGLSQDILEQVIFPTITLIHCWKGSHRTGAVVAKLRQSQGWPNRNIWDEMQKFGFGKKEKHLALYRSVFGDKDENTFV